MTKTYLLGIFIFWSIISWGQTRVNYGLIRQNIRFEVSELYYPTLFARYKAGDSTMTIEEKRHCYYGFSFQENYNPYKRAKRIDRVESLVKKNPINIDTTFILQIIDSALNSHPFDLNALSYKIQYCKSREKRKEQIAKTKIEIITSAIKSSGDGQSKKRPFSVIYIPHELLIINSLGLTRTGKQSLMGGNLDVLGITKDEKKIKKLYFDVSRMQAGNPKNVLFHQFYHAFLLSQPLDFDKMK